MRTVAADEKLHLSSAGLRSRPGSGEAAGRLGLFVGRRRELAELDSLLEDARAGRLSCALLVGEPGIGKTRIAREFADRTIARGIPLVFGCCTEEHDTPAYGPWRSGLSRMSAGSGLDLPPLTGEGARAVAALVPELRARVHRRPAPAHDGELVDRKELLASLARFLADLSSAGALVLILDNAPWADPDSLKLLEHLAREMPSSRIMIIATARESKLGLDHPLTQVLGELMKLPTFRRIHLRGLARSDVKRYVEHALNGPQPDSVVDRIHDGTEGNPFFMMEIVRTALARRRGEPAPRATEGIRDAISRRLAALPAGCIRVLSYASVIGRRFDLSLLARLMGRRGIRGLETVLRKAGQAGFVLRMPDGQWQFAHALFRETLYEDQSPASRAGLHARIAGLIESHRGPAGSGWRGEVVRHLLAGLGRTGTNTRRLVRCTLRAAQEALGAGAPEKSLSLLTAAIEALESVDRPTVRARDLAALLHLRGRALHESGRSEGQQSLIRAYELYIQAGDTERALEVALTRSHFRLRLPDLEVAIQSGPMEELRRKALTVVQSGSLSEGRLLCEGHDRDGLERALRIARRKHDRELEITCLARSAQMNAHEGDLAGSSALWRQVVEFLRAGADREALHHALYWYSYPLAVGGGIAQARVLAAEMLRNAHATRSSRMLWESHYASAALAAMAGDWTACREHTDRVFSLTTPDTPTFSRTFAAVNRGIVELETGHPEAGHRWSGSIAAGRGGSGDSAFPCAAAKIARITGDTRGLPELAKRLDAISNEGTVFPLDWWETARHVARSSIAVLLGDRSTAAAEIPYFQRWKGCFSPLGMSGRWYAAVLGMLESVEGELDSAVDHLKEATDSCAAAGLRPECAWICLDLAEVLLQRGRQGDQREAALALEEGRAIGAGLGMTPLLAKIDACRDRLRRSPEWRTPLTRREAEVLRLVARGFTNHEVGVQLHISERTVATHLRTIFDKLGASNRAEATAWAVRNRIEEE